MVCITNTGSDAFPGRPNDFAALTLPMKGLSLTSSPQGFSCTHNPSCQYPHCVFPIHPNFCGSPLEQPSLRLLAGGSGFPLFAPAPSLPSAASGFTWREVSLFHSFPSQLPLEPALCVKCVRYGPAGKGHGQRRWGKTAGERNRSAGGGSADREEADLRFLRGGRAMRNENGGGEKHNRDSETGDFR